MASDEEELLVRDLSIDMEDTSLTAHPSGPRLRLAHLLPPLAPLDRAPGLPPFRPPPSLAAAAAAEPRVAFKGWPGAPRHWEQWVAKLRPIHEHMWRKVGILEAVLASTYRVKRDVLTLLQLASFWSGETNTFAFPWGETTVSLEDVAVLGGFATDGAPVRAPLLPEWRADESALNEVRLSFNRSACKKAHHSAWMKHFFGDKTVDAEMEHEAFLALWLARFVFPAHPETTMRQAVFPLAVRLARGDRVALAPAVLASLYRDLREMKAYLITATTSTNVEALLPLSVYSPLYILQLWAWERFPALWAGKESPVKDGEPRAARWHDVGKRMEPTLARKMLESGKEFVWQPYAASGGFVQACHKNDGWVRGSEVTGNVELRSLAHCLRTCELVGMDCIEQYLPHRVAMQFGLDQDVPGDVPRANQDWEVAWKAYEMDGKNIAFGIPQSEPGVTTRYARWWKQQLAPSDFDARTASIAVEWKGSKRKVKKTPAALEAEAEKERKMKKARASSADKKRKLEELYDAKLSDWLAAARNGSSGSGSGKRSPSAKSEKESEADKVLFSDVETGNDQIPLLVRKQKMTPTVKLNKDKKMKLGKGDNGNSTAKPVEGTKEKGVKVKGGKIINEDFLVKRAYLKKMKKAVVSMEGFAVTEGTIGEGSGKIVKDTKELASVDSPDVSNKPEEAKLPVLMEKEKISGCVSDGNDEEVATGEVFTADNPPDVSDGQEEGTAAIMEENKLNFYVNKSPDVTDRPEEGATVMLVKAEELNLAIDKSIEVSNKPEEVTTTVMEEKEEKVSIALAVERMNLIEQNLEIVMEADDCNAISEEVGRATGGEKCSSGTATEREAADEGVMNNGLEAVALVGEVLPINQINNVGNCIELLDVKEDNVLAAEVCGRSSVETTSGDAVAKDQREVPGVEEIERGKNDEMVENDNLEKPKETPLAQMVECGEDIVLMEKDRRELKEVPERKEKEVTDKNMLEGQNEEVDKANNLAKKDTGEIPMEVAEVEHAEEEDVNSLTQRDAKEEHREVTEVEHAEVEEAKRLTGFDTKGEPEEVVEVEHAEEDEAKRPTDRDTDEKLEDVHEVVRAEVEKAKELIGNGTDEKLEEKHEEVPEVENTEMGEATGPMEEDIDGKLKEVPDVGYAEIPQIKHAKIRSEALTEEDIAEKLSADHKDPPEEVVEKEPKEVCQVEHAEDDKCKVSTKKDIEENTKDALGIEQAEEGRGKSWIKQWMEDNIDEVTQVKPAELSERLTGLDIVEKPEEITQAQAKEIVKDMVQASENSISEEFPCTLATEQLKEADLKEASDYMDKPCIEDVELINERESPSDAAVMNVEGLENHKTLGMQKELACENKEKGISEDTVMLDSSLLKSDSKAVEVDETHATDGIKNQETLDFHKEMEERQNLGVADEEKRTRISEDANMHYGELKTVPATMEVNEAEPTKGTENQKPLDMEEEQMLGEKLDCETTDGNRRNILKEANILDSGELRTVAEAVKIDEAKSTEGIKIQEACIMKVEQASEEREFHGVENENERRNSEDVNMIDSGELKSDVALVEINGDASMNNQEGLGMEKEWAMEEKHAQGIIDENNKKRFLGILGDIDMLECGEVKSDATVIVITETTLTTQVGNAVGVKKINPKNKEEGTAWEDKNTNGEGSASSQDARHESEGVLPPEPADQVEAEEGVSDNKMEVASGRVNNVASVQGQTPTNEEATIAPSNMDDDQDDKNEESAEDLIIRQGRYASNPVNTSCQPSKVGRPSIEEVRRIHNGRFCYLKTIKESEGKVRSEPSNRIQINNIGYYPRQAFQEPFSVCKDVKVPLYDSIRACGRDRALDLVVTGPPEETSRWRQEQLTLQMLEDVQAARVAEKTRMEMEIRILKAQIASMERKVMNLDHFGEVISRSKR